MKVDNFDHMETELRKSIEEWKQQLDIAYNQHPRLLFLDCKQLPHLMNRLSQLVMKKVEMQHAYKLLLPYMSGCFPEYLPKGRESVISIDILRIAFEGALKANEAAVRGCPGIGVAYLKVTTDILTIMEKSIKERAHKEKFISQQLNSNPPEVVR